MPQQKELTAWLKVVQTQDEPEKSSRNLASTGNSSFKKLQRVSRPFGVLLQQ
jgi:hypothetical protein